MLKNASHTAPDTDSNSVEQKNEYIDWLQEKHPLGNIFNKVSTFTFLYYKVVCKIEPFERNLSVAISKLVQQLGRNFSIAINAR